MCKYIVLLRWVKKSEEGEEEEEEEVEEEEEAEDGGEDKEIVWDIVFEEISRGLAFWSEVDLFELTWSLWRTSVVTIVAVWTFQRKKIEEDV